MASGEVQDELQYHGARHRWDLIDIQEVWRFRELIWMFAVRDFKVRYRQTFVGIAWALIQPLAMMLVFSFFFRVSGGRPSDSSLPYAVIALCGLIPWQLFASIVSAGTQSIVINQQLVTKVYFPKIILPLSSVAVALVDFCIAFCMLLLVMLWYQVVPTMAILLLPLMTLIVIVCSLAVSLWLSALNAIYRDVQFLVPFMLQFGLLASPTVYEASMVSPQWQWLYSLNPMVGALEGFRWALLGTAPPAIVPMVISLSCMLAILLGGLVYFRRMERFFSDRI